MDRFTPFLDNPEWEHWYPILFYPPGLWLFINLLWMW